LKSYKQDGTAWGFSDLQGTQINEEEVEDVFALD